MTNICTWKFLLENSLLSSLRDDCPLWWIFSFHAGQDLGGACNRVLHKLKGHPYQGRVCIYLNIEYLVLGYGMVWWYGTIDSTRYQYYLD